MKATVDICCFLWVVVLICTIIISLFELVKSGMYMYLNPDYCNINKYSGWCNVDVAQLIGSLYLIGFIVLINLAYGHIQLIR